MLSLIFHTTSKRPVLLVGNGARAAGAAELITEFAKKTRIPVLTTMNAVDLAQDDLQFGFIGTYGNRVSNLILSECDLLISVGARLGLRQIGHLTEKFAPKAKLIRADIDQYELSRDIKENEEKHFNDFVHGCGDYTFGAGQRYRQQQSLWCRRRQYQLYPADQQLQR